VECIRTFFKRRFRYEGAVFPHFQCVNEEEEADGEHPRLDVAVVQDKKFKILEKVWPLTSAFGVTDPRLLVSI
jgi:hypothetical protein